MRVIQAQSAGFCYGVERAVRMAEEAAAAGGCVMLGSIIHNDSVVRRLEALGARQVQSAEEVQPGETVLIRAHGEPVETYRTLEARGARVLALTTEAGGEALHKRVDAVVTVPETEAMLLPQLGVVPLQLLAYYLALERGCDIDKPRNLAKSVTVE